MGYPFDFRFMLSKVSGHAWRMILAKVQLAHDNIFFQYEHFHEIPFFLPFTLGTLLE